jgi:hypothetical protein
MSGKLGKYAMTEGYKGKRFPTEMRARAVRMDLAPGQDWHGPSVFLGTRRFNHPSHRLQDKICQIPFRSHFTLRSSHDCWRRGAFVEMCLDGSGQDVAGKGVALPAPFDRSG